MTVQQADLGTQYWATSAQFQERFDLEVQNQTPEGDDRIEEATDVMQARWAEATGGDIPDDLPSDVPNLLQYATADLAASLAHGNFANNVQSENDNDPREVFLENRAQKMFDAWKKQADLDPGSEQTGDASSVVDGVSGVIGGEDRSPIERGDGY